MTNGVTNIFRLKAKGKTCH